MQAIRRFFTTESTTVCLKECLDCSHERMPAYLKISTESMLDSVKPYTKHTFIVTPTDPSNWPAKIEQWPPLEQIVDSKISLCAQYPYSNGVDSLNDVKHVDVITYPESTRAHNLHIDNLVNCSSSTHQKISVFVCTHTIKDKRCGVAGPLILAEFHRILTERDLLHKIDIYGCSHLGGHKFAGTMVIYPVGVWYGRVEACHVDQIITDTLLGGKVIDDLYRGTISF